MLSTALDRLRSAQFTMAPDFLSPALTGPVFRFSLDTLDFSRRGVHYNYQVDQPAIIKACYSNNSSITVALGAEDGETYCQLAQPGGRKVNNRSQASSGRFRQIYVMPPVGALLNEETYRDRKYLHKHLNGYLSYRHIRNQMAEFPSEFKVFTEMLHDTWPNLQVSSLESGLGEHQNQYGLNLRDGPFVSEVALVGSGLQAWIQTLWFLSRVDEESTVVLDEPDVYLHADLQRKLVKILSAERYRQTIVATHSMEMISDVAPAEIVSVTKREARSKPLSSSSQAQSAVNAIGTNLNIQLSKLANAGRVVFLEGKDYAFLDQIAFKKEGSFYDRFSKIPHFSVGGMNNWPRAALAAQAFYETSGGAVQSTMFIDRDYKPQALFDDAILEASKSNLSLYVWNRKEIENYFLDTILIHSYIQRRAQVQVALDEVERIVNETTSALISELQVLIADGCQASNRKLALPTAMKAAQKIIEEHVVAGRSHKDLISGKAALSMISGACQAKWGVSLSALTLCRHMTYEQVPPELAAAVSALA